MSASLLPPIFTKISAHVASIGLASLLALSAFGTASACGPDYGTDNTAVQRVQSSWPPAENYLRNGHYARALARLRATSAYAPGIHDALTRRCINEGANMRIASATAGQMFLSAHPGNYAGAHAAATRAWRNYPLSGLCP